MLSYIGLSLRHDIRFIWPPFSLFLPTVLQRKEEKVLTPGLQLNFLADFDRVNPVKSVSFCR